MYTFAYDYLKAQPQERYDLIRSNWTVLFMDASVPEVIKRELRDLALHDIPLTDTVLYWNKEYIMKTMMESKTLPFISLDVYTKPWAEYLYTLVQLERAVPLYALQFMAVLPTSLLDMPVDIQLVEKIYNFVYKNYGHNISRSIEQFSSVLVSVLSTVEMQGMDNKLCEVILKHCDHTLVKSFSRRDQIKRVAELLNDVDDHDHLFKSINEIERAHDARTERAAKELMAVHKGKGFAYNKELKDMVKQYGFFLPSSPEALVKRGQQHSNCVATYNNKHSNPASNGHTVSRIFFTKEATLELSIECMHNVIVSTTVLQYKGRYNKDVERGKELTALRINMVGAPIDLISVENIIVTEEQNDQD